MPGANCPPARSADRRSTAPFASISNAGWGGPYPNLNSTIVRACKVYPTACQRERELPVSAAAGLTAPRAELNRSPKRRPAHDFPGRYEPWHLA